VLEGLGRRAPNVAMISESAPVLSECDVLEYACLQQYRDREGKE